MNESSITQNTAVAEPAQRSQESGTESLSMSSTHHDGGTAFSAEMAQKVLRLTGGIRLTSRPAHNWHHCGINE